jgi:hypothetical protein
MLLFELGVFNSLFTAKRTRDLLLSVKFLAFKSFQVDHLSFCPFRYLKIPGHIF